MQKIPMSMRSRLSPINSKLLCLLILTLLDEGFETDTNVESCLYHAKFSSIRLNLLILSRVYISGRK